MLKLYEVSHYLILEAKACYRLARAEELLRERLAQDQDHKEHTLIIDIRYSDTSPRMDELEAWGRYLMSINERFSCGIYITGDDLRFGLSNVVIANSGADEKLRRVKVGEAAESNPL
ncbi:MAG: hypothetical protein GKR90_27195 [Pseudomonadales bacterium]|nr:hypothetical protein [Pseudomonadales bacterium]